MLQENLRILIVAENASLNFGGEAALPLHYFRVLRQRGYEVWMLVHERTRQELKAKFPQDFERIYFIPDTFLHRFLHKFNKPLPDRLYWFTFGLMMRLLTQILQYSIIKKLIREKKINVIHQPIPVSPKEPSLIFGLGVPVIIGPMNGGMNFPPAFEKKENLLKTQAVKIARWFSDLANILIPGKYLATTLLVANSRTREALPSILHSKKIVELVENGVDLSVWQQKLLNQYGNRSVPQSWSENTLITEDSAQFNAQTEPITKFVYLGRLVDWKALDLLLMATKRVLEQIPIKLEIIGTGNQKSKLEKLAQELGLMSDPSTEKIIDTDVVHFAGWLSQADCAKKLELTDALILPSLYECGGAVVLEAMAMSKPVIATNWGGPADYITENCGILVDPISKESFIQGLADAMIKFAKNPEMRQQMGEAGRQRVVNHFDWEKKVDFILRIYQQELESHQQKELKVKGEEVFS
ncbi:glycosyltransferase family 4 protein [Gloeothece verrucosa]|uniref:Glycosyl transferase group 1 n=1 Tax=Gloeothece verrucosa (strain PCC 7822) TaxID=497965 RepID=E0UBN8_GLOV7|nr:glycosyltransferase family 4 protein [Gloeothece verrucosa]ADN13982.1 glycosyl transferase group 1 [Gloeothece verrucosa PCC 7822]